MIGNSHKNTFTTNRDHIYLKLITERQVVTIYEVGPGGGSNTQMLAKNIQNIGIMHVHPNLNQLITQNRQINTFKT